MMDMSKTEQGSRAEGIALAHLQANGLILLVRNYKTPGRGGGEVDLIMQEPARHPHQEPTLVFVEVRQRSHHLYGGAAASVLGVKQRRVIFAARYYLLRLAQTPPCRFDVVSIEGELSGHPHIKWLRGAFDAPSY